MLDDKLLSIMIDRNIINNDEYEVYKYGLEVLFLKVTHTISIILIGFVFGKLTETFVFLLFFSLLRKYIDGYHADTKKKCLTMTIVLSLGIVLLFSTNIEMISQEIINYILIISAIILLIVTKKTIFFKQILAICYLAICLAFILSLNYLSLIMVYAIIITCILAIKGNPNNS